MFLIPKKNVKNFIKDLKTMDNFLEILEMEFFLGTQKQFQQFENLVF